MTRSPALPVRNRRRGLTIVDVIVILIVVGLLVALLLPATRSSGISARRLQCLNNVGQMGKAVVNYQSINGDRLPPLATSGSKLPAVGWPIALLPLLDSARLARRIRDDRSSTIDPNTGVPTLTLRFFTCPDDPNNFRVPGGLSYAANAGYLSSAVWGDETADADAAGSTFHRVGAIDFGHASTPEERLSRHFATGVFWRGFERPTEGTTDAAVAETGREIPTRMTGDYISRHDGLSTTLLFAENANSRNWASANVNDIGFGLSVATDPLTGRPDRSSPTGRVGHSLGPLELTESWGLAHPGGDDATPTTLTKKSSDRLPRPSSFHAGGILNICYADGHAVAISDSIDPSVYARLLTPAGETYGQAPVDINELE